MEDEFRLLTLQVIGAAILSLEPAECDRVFPDLYLPVMTESNIRALRPWRKYLPLPSWFQYRSRVGRLNAYIIGLLRARWQDRLDGHISKQPDVLDRLMASIEARGEAWSVGLETQLCYEIKTFLLAGHETSAAMLTWCLHELTQHPECLAKVRGEADAVFGLDEDGQLPDRAAFESMPYTLAALRETLRKYSIVPVVTRKAVADSEVCGYHIPRGTYLVLTLRGVHDSWQSPSEWQPERFMPGGEFDKFDESSRPYMFLPFIQGPRNCLGQHFALLEARIVLGLLVKNFTFHTCRADAGVPNEAVIPIGPAHGMEMNVVRR
ncbi:hypothetical protein WJX72_005241 [[Myrmecia] bisecta]|uniref:Cytochrome P450 n=1 Tax=[Myrmecia] bisecta TaxID=41462 RepID=A0AAW1Q7E2_9CHLO